MDNITISKQFDDVKLSSDEEYEIEFQVPPNIAEIQVNVTTTVNVSHFVILILPRLYPRTRRKTLPKVIPLTLTTTLMTLTSVKLSSETLGETIKFSLWERMESQNPDVSLMSSFIISSTIPSSKWCLKLIRMASSTWEN